MDFYKNQMEKPDFFENFSLYFSHLPPKASELKKPGSKAPRGSNFRFFSGEGLIFSFPLLNYNSGYI
ncbi:MAG: hypothetical protein IJ992_03110 [Lentisphaeria bacterium]|nr:hypothetical protein [Lentisphaeria bacterium]